jgi:cytochrome b pre-mRNA-processing protein 3
MIFRLLRQNPSIDTIQDLYGAIVAQARLPSFYLRYGVPDTVDGRFDLIVVHLFLMVERIGRAQALPADMGQQLIETFCQDLDHNLREMGVGDLTVPRRMRGYMEAFLGRSDAYRAAFASGDRDACARALARNVFSRSAPHDGAWLLADYMGLAAQTLAALPAEALAGGKVEFPDPEAIPAVSA